MTQVSASNERYLRREFVVPTIFEIMEPYLTFLDILPKVKADSRAIKYKQESTSASSDTLKKTPPARTAGARWVKVDITNIEVKSALLNSNGFSIEIDEDAIQFTEGIDEIQRAYKRVAFWLAESMNTGIGTALTAGVTQGGGDWTPTDTWGGADAAPVEDLLNFEALMDDQEGYPYNLTDVYLHKTNWRELKSYLTSIDVGDLKQREIYGMPAIKKSSIDIPIVGSTVHKQLSGITENAILGLDRNNPAATVFYNNNPKYSSKTISYKGSDGALKTVPNMGFNFNTYLDNETHNTVMQFWIDHVCVVKEPKAGLYDTGL